MENTKRGTSRESRTAISRRRSSHDHTRTWGNEGKETLKKSLLSAVADAGHTSLMIIYEHGVLEERNLKKIPDSMPPTLAS